jgi:acetyl-CoA carboxylase carboxyltransferase component
MEITFDPTHKRGAIHSGDGETIATAARTALDEGLPLVIRIASSGADIEAGLSAVYGWGVAARELVRASGIVPIICVVVGPAVSGPALLIGLCDIVIMTTDSYAFVSGPVMVRNFTGQTLGTDELGGAGAHARNTGVVDLIVDDEAEADELVGELLERLPLHTDQLAPNRPTNDPADRLSPELHDVLPASASGSYDVREVIRSIADDGDMMELRATWAANLVTALAHIDGRSVGVIANQPQTVAGTLDIPASRKGAGFVAFCDAFNLPLITLVDTSGFYPGKDLEWRGMIRYGAQLAFAYARATVPRISVTLRKSYGGAYIVMDSKYMGNDLALAWPSAEIAVMGAKGAVEILHRKASESERVGLAEEYEERLLNPYIAAGRGSIDIVIDPSDTRKEVVAGLLMLETKREQLPERRHDNTPL